MKILLFISLFAFSVGQLIAQTSTTESAQSQTTPQQSHVTIEQVLTVLDEKYVYPETAEKMRTFVVQRLMAGAYGNVASQKALIEQLQIDLRKVSRDGHISLHLAKGAIDRTDQRRPITQSELEVHSSVIEAADNRKIGYLRFNKFSSDPQVKSGLVDAMKELEPSDALIIDLRNNTGGDPNLVAFLISYLVDPNTLLWSIFDRNGESVAETSSVDVGQRYQGDVCILIANKTYSAAEAFSYTLKHLGRACVVGDESSGGGAHLIDIESVNHEIDIRVPVARAYNAITKSNWEGVGVIPTLSVDPSQAKPAAIEYLENRIK